MSNEKAFKYNYRYFAKTQLKIINKASKLVPFIFNQAQEHVHKCLTDQLKKQGSVRAIIIKGRQQGCSTYIAGRFYHRAITRENKRVYILSHLAATTQMLFNIVERYWDNQNPGLRPHKGTSNRNQMVFDAMGSSYTVGTAGSKATGRGGTIQLFHGSEAAYWENTDDIQTGLIQSVPSGALAKGTEIIFESTANGMSGMLYNLVQAALRGENEYQVIFVPWYWQDEYREPVPDNFELSDEDREYMELYKLDMQQMAWRHKKKQSYVSEGKSDWMFKQEYPATLQEAFQASGDPFIPQELIWAARKRKVRDQGAEIVIGLDCSGEGADRTVLGIRKGKELQCYYVWNRIKPMELVGKIANFIKKYSPAMVFIDKAYGWAIADRLHELGYKNVRCVDFGSGASNPVYLNKRTEMIFDVRTWLEEGGSIPDNDEIHADLACMPKEEVTSSQRLKFPPKEKIKKDYGLSPDIFDMLALTLAFPVYSRKNEELKPGYKMQTKGLRSMRRKFDRDKLKPNETPLRIG